MADEVRMIDAEKLKRQIIEGDGHDDDRFTEGYNFAINEIRGYIDNMPTIEAEPVKQDTELSIILQDYGIKDTDTLRYILDQYQKVIVEITHGRLSKLTYPADTIVNMEEDVSREYWEKELVKYGRWIDFPECLEYEGALDKEYFVCSECHHVWNTVDNCAETFICCPNCGSKNRMDGDSE